MEKEFVTYELALRMKQLGFDKPCFGGYNPNPVNDDDLRTLIYPTIKLNFEGEDIIFNDTESDEPNCWIIEDDVILAPTFSQAFRWFREKYELHSFIDCKWKNLGWEFELVDLSKMETISSIDRYNYKTPEEAELECLKKLIEIIENQK
jgi:hypothetical protein